MATKFQAEKNSRYTKYQIMNDAESFTDMLTTALTKTRKLNVITRHRLEEIFKEQDLSLEGIARGGYQGDSLQVKGVDYILTGAITEFWIDGEKPLKGEQIIRRQTSATMAVDLRLLKVRTGEVGFAETVRVRAGGHPVIRNGYMQKQMPTNPSKVVAEVLRKAANNATNAIVLAIYPIRVLGVSDKGIAILSYGGVLLKKGDLLNVYVPGEDLVDMDTNERLGFVENYVGRLRVISTTSTVSRAQVLYGREVIAKGQIARLIQKPWEEPTQHQQLSPAKGSELF